MRLAAFVAAQPWQPAVEREVVLTSDGLGYHTLALALLERGEFSLERGGPPETLRTPGYPLALAAVYAIAGPRPWVAIALQLVLQCVTCCWLYRAALRSGGVAGGLFTGGLLAFDPAFVIHGCGLWSETIFVALLVGALGLLAATPASRSLAPAAILLGLATLVRPAGLFAAPGLLAFVALRYRRRPRKLLAAGCLTLACFAAPLVPWMARNLAVNGRAALSSAGPFNLLFLTVARMERGPGDPSGERTRERLRAESALGEASARPFEIADRWAQVAWSHAASGPIDFARALAEGVGGGLANLGTTEWSRALRLAPGLLEDGAVSGWLRRARRYAELKGPAALLLAAVAAAHLLLLYLGAAAALRPALATRNPRPAWAALCLGAGFLASLCIAGNARLRLPLAACLALLAGQAQYPTWAMRLPSLTRARRLRERASEKSGGC